MNTTDQTTTAPGTDVEVARSASATSALAIPTDDPWADVADGFVGHVDAREVTPIVPRLAFNANKGYGFIDEMTGAVVAGEGQSINVSWLAWSESRAWWAQEFGKGNEQPDCRSGDMLVPDPASPDRQSDTCAACPHSKWSRTPGGDEGPDCHVRLNVLLWLIDGDDSRITRTAFGGIALKHVKRYLGFFASKGVKLPPMSVVTTITVASEVTDYGEKLVPHFSIGDRVSREEAAPLIRARDEFMAEWRSLLADDLAKPEAGGDRVPPETVEATVYEDGQEPF